MDTTLIIDSYGCEQKQYNQKYMEESSKQQQMGHDQIEPLMESRISEFFRS